jgi:hypothetical protein
MELFLSLVFRSYKIMEKRNKKSGDIPISENVSGDVPMTGLEPALCCQK